MNKMTEREAESAFNDYLNDVYGDVEVAGLTYSTALALAEIDPIAHSCGMADWASYENIEIGD